MAVHHTHTKYDLPSNERILQRCSQRVPDVQASCDIWWGRRDDEDALVLGAPVRAGLRREETLGIPPVVPRGLDGDGVVSVAHWL